MFAILLLLIPAQPSKHWSFVPPVRPPIPSIANVHNPIDAFIVERLTKAGLKLSPQADRTTLIRRVTLDLTGLPPTPPDVDAFLNDNSPNAYEKLVERLLASPRYGERMAIRWLDAARYADTCGYQNDGERIMWRWRDWVIDAYNANLPFDQFTIEQLAGDLLPNPTLEQRIATGFNRNHRGNAEGGIIPEEYAVEYVVDRVDTTATVWLGLTMGCARCHDHKFDPFSQRDYYQLFAFFNSIPEHGRAIKYGNSPPMIASPTREQQRQLAELDAQIADAERLVHSMRPRLRGLQLVWESEQRSSPNRWTPTRALKARFYKELGDFDGTRFVEAGDQGNFGYFDKFTLAARIRPDDVVNAAIMSRTSESSQGDGYVVRIVDGRVRVELTKRYLDDALRVETKRRLDAGKSYHIAVTYDGSRLAQGVQIFIDGKRVPTITLLDELNQSYANKEPFRIGTAGGPTGRFRGRIEEVRIYDDSLTVDEIAALAGDESARNRFQFLQQAAPKEIRDSHYRLFELQQERRALVERFPTTMVMQELPEPKPAYVLKRGEYDKHGERVDRAVPVVLRSKKQGDEPRGSHNRLTFARWLMSPDNPLTARVAVNRLWQQFFGVGFVKTGEDFGSQGERPSHSDLLDWLATEYIRIGWDTKRLIRTIVTSATYRQSSQIRNTELGMRNEDNRLLVRFPRLRLPAETIRDQALAASGLLVERYGGPSVRPYQPAGLSVELGAEEQKTDRGAGLYRRGLYTFWKRTVAPPNMLTFDAAGRETCSVREVRTNTPLQALTLLNDVTFVECARKLAERSMREGGSNPTNRIQLAFRLVLARSPSQAELTVLLDGYRDHLAEYRRSPEATARVLKTGDSPIDAKLDRAELAAQTAIASLILNLDEAVTKE